MSELSEAAAKILNNPTCAEPIIFSLIKPRDVEIKRLKEEIINRKRKWVSLHDTICEDIFIDYEDKKYILNLIHPYIPIEFTGTHSRADNVPIQTSDETGKIEHRDRRELMRRRTKLKGGE